MENHTHLLKYVVGRAAASCDSKRMSYNGSKARLPKVVVMRPIRERRLEYARHRVGWPAFGFRRPPLLHLAFEIDTQLATKEDNNSHGSTPAP